ncbi:MAG: hypothetical protein M3Q71_10255 [Chloroflexota bacterium]|nr:hypothetical protein [Chloroflexota bacterium]MDP9471033.1 hypothetical protein [Chloroflexota bacterium]
MTSRHRERSVSGIRDLSPEVEAAIDRNIDGAFDFLQSLVDDPTLVDTIPDGTPIVLDHPDDPALTQANLQASAAGQRDGHRVHVHRVRQDLGGSAPER